MDLKDIAENDELIEIGRKAVEDVLIDFRDSRISILGRSNGLVVREADGQFSSIIRLGTPEAIQIALRAIDKHLKCGDNLCSCEVGRREWSLASGRCKTCCRYFTKQKGGG